MHLHVFVGPMQLQVVCKKLQLSLESFEIHITILREEILHAQYFFKHLSRTKLCKERNIFTQEIFPSIFSH